MKNVSETGAGKHGMFHMLPAARPHGKPFKTAFHCFFSYAQQ